MRWKKIFMAAAALIVALAAAFYVFVAFYDFNNLKPFIAEQVRQATGRQLTIGGNLNVALGLRPTLVAENVSLQNARWGSRPYLIRVKRLEFQLALLPLILGRLDFVHLAAFKPEVRVEFDSAGTCNFEFDAASQAGDTAQISPPPLIFDDVQIKEGLFIYKDAELDVNFSVRIDHLQATIPGFAKSLQLDFAGAFDDIPLTLAGSVGPIWAWVEPGYSLPANLAVTAGGATAKIKGLMRNASDLKNLAFSVTAAGPSVAGIARLAGADAVPELGAFRLQADVSDPDGKLALEKLDLQVGSESLAAVRLTGAVRDLLARRGIDLDFSVHGKDSASLAKLGFPVLPRRGGYRIAGKITDLGPDVFAASDLVMAVAKNAARGRVVLNLAAPTPFLTAALASQQFELGPFKLELKLTGPVEKLAIKKLHLRLGTAKRIKIELNGSINNVRGFDGVNIKFQAQSRNLANLKQLAGRPLPFRGAFTASGNVRIPVHKKLKITQLRITAGQTRINGTLGLDLTGKKPKLKAVLASRQIDLQSLLIPKLAKKQWVKFVAKIRPVKLTARLAGFSKAPRLRQLDLQAGTRNGVQVHLTGSIEDLAARRGLELNFSVQGRKLAQLKKLAGPSDFLAPIAVQGAYAVSGRISGPSAKSFNVSDLKLILGKTVLTGRLDANLSGGPPQITASLAARRFDLKALRPAHKGLLANLAKLENLGPFNVNSQIAIRPGHISLKALDLTLGTAQLAAVSVKGSIENLNSQRGLDLDFQIRGRQIAKLEKITGQRLHLQGVFAAAGRLTDPAVNNFKLSNLKITLGQNHFAGRLGLDLSGAQPRLTTLLAAPKLNLQPLAVAGTPWLQHLRALPNLGPLRVNATLVGPLDRPAVASLDLSLGNDALAKIRIKGRMRDPLARRGFNFHFDIRGRDLANLAKLWQQPPSGLQEKFDISGRIQDPAANVYRIPDFKAVLGASDGSGAIEVNLAQQRPKITVDLSSQKIDLRPFLVPREKKAVPGAAAKESTTPKKKVFSSQPFHLEGLKLADAELKFRGRQLLLPRFAFKDVMAGVQLQNGNLIVRPLKMEGGGGGKSRGHLELLSQNNPLRLALALKTDQLDLGPMLEKLGYQKSLEGLVDADVKLDGRGDSPAALMADLNGKIFIAMHDGKVDSKYLHFLQKYLGSNVLQLINPFQDKSAYTHVNCFYNKTTIKDGQADAKLLLDTDQTSLFGAGDINLKSEEIELTIKPVPKKGFGHRNVGTISFSLKELSQPFRLGGTLAEPSLEVDPTHTAFMLGKLAGALASTLFLGPVGLAVFFADVSLGKTDACQVAEETMTKKTLSPEAKPAGEKPPKKDGYLKKRSDE